jgi:hypothetical protein
VSALLTKLPIWGKLAPERWYVFGFRWPAAYQKPGEAVVREQLHKVGASSVAFFFDFTPGLDNNEEAGMLKTDRSDVFVADIYRASIEIGATAGGVFVPSEDITPESLPKLMAGAQVITKQLGDMTKKAFDIGAWLLEWGPLLLVAAALGAAVWYLHKE